MSNVAKLKKRALDYEQKKQFDKALDAYMQVLDALGDHVDEADVALFNRVGDLLLRQGNVGAAVDHYERAVDLYTEGGFHNNAIALCSKILRNAPGRNSVYYKLGRISAKKGFTSDAKSNFLEYADRMQRIGHTEEAFRALKEFADLCPDQDDIRLMLADQLVRGDRKAEAIEQLQLLYEKFQAEGRAQEAKATLERMTAIDPAHQPTPGVSRPTPKANDLIFLDVGFDAPGASSRPVTGSAPAVPVADAAPIASPGEDAEPEQPTEQPLPLIDLESSSTVEIAPVDGLSSGAIFDQMVDGEATPTHELVSQLDTELVSGFEQTSFGGVDSVDPQAIAPLPGIEQSTPLEGDAPSVDLSVESTPAAEPIAEPLDATSSESLADQGWSSGEAHGGTEDDSLPILDISLDIIDDGAPDASDDLTLIFPDAQGAAEWNGSASSEGEDSLSPSPALDDGSAGGEYVFSTELPDVLELVGEADETPEDELRFEPLLQLPELDSTEDPADVPDDARDLPLISQPDDSLSEFSSFGPGDDSFEVDPPSHAAELRFLDLGTEERPLLVTQPGESMPAPFAAVSAEPTLDDLRSIAELNPEDWEARRRLAEALLEAGDREAGLEELEAAMVGVERTGDLRGATGIVNEMIRVEPHTVRYHQKRVEYAVRANDRSLLAEAYYSLAESLFQMGEIEKSRAVYSRVLELLPGDPRARAALQAIDADAPEDEEEAFTPEPVIEPEPKTPAPTDEADEPAAASLPAEPEPTEPQPTDDGAGGPAATDGEERLSTEDEPPAAQVAADQAATSAPPARSTSSTPAGVHAVPHARDREPEPANASGSDFVNLAEWLSEDAPTRNTRMVVDVKEPEIQEQVDFSEMLAMFKQGVAANVDEADHEAHYDLGVAYKEMGLLDEAISEFQKALRGTENRARTYEALGQCFVERGQHQIAVTILSRALGDKSYTDDMLVGVLYLLGFASETLGRWADAQRFYERVFAVDIEFRDIAQRLAVAERAGK